jgi:hypothetical protein
MPRAEPCSAVQQDFAGTVVFTGARDVPARDEAVQRNNRTPFATDSFPTYDAVGPGGHRRSGRSLHGPAKVDPRELVGGQAEGRPTDDLTAD